MLRLGTSPFGLHLPCASQPFNHTHHFRPGSKAKVVRSLHSAGFLSLISLLNHSAILPTTKHPRISVERPASTTFATHFVCYISTI